jgi:diacylglycerol kinase (ATP)
MRARTLNVLRASRDAQHDDRAAASQDDPFADVHGGGPDEPAHAQRDASRDPPPVDHETNGQTPMNGAAVGSAHMRSSSHAMPRSSPSTHAESAGSAEAHEPLGPDDPLAPLPFNPYKGNRGVTRAWHAMKNSLAGFRVAIREESAFRQELTLAAILVPCGLAVPVDPVSRVLLLGSVLLVLIVELLNSSVEAAIDRISLERHELSRRAKDLGSAAVMVALFMCVMTWALIVGPLVVHRIGMLSR